MQLHWVLVGLILFHSFDSSLSAEPHWNYRELGPDVWPDFYPTCGRTAQSPINIKTACTIYQSYAPFQFSSAYDLTQDFTLTNNGHTISGAPVDKTKFPLTLTGGGLTKPFTFVNFHLHWGENYKSGSEHQL
jgi:carbonic anhydrase